MHLNRYSIESRYQGTICAPECDIWYHLFPPRNHTKSNQTNNDRFRCIQSLKLSTICCAVHVVQRPNKVSSGCKLLMRISTFHTSWTTCSLLQFHGLLQRSAWWKWLPRVHEIKHLVQLQKVNLLLSSKKKRNMGRTSRGRKSYKEWQSKSND